ncbi:hypothetical protein RRF57_006113 [Xylaria bambusicola]|uniref:Uncharacterized protein n=1 Tax=Xylaria bambusicola TaxID=326684 RepID=A0AAN7Z8L0_9PEZI
MTGRLKLSSKLLTDVNKVLAVSCAYSNDQKSQDNLELLVAAIPVIPAIKCMSEKSHTSSIAGSRNLTVAASGHPILGVDICSNLICFL